MGLSVKGSVACRFSEQDIICYLVFTPDPSIETTLDDVLEILRQNRITLSTSSIVNKILGEFQTKKEPFETILVSGIPPELPEAEHGVWNDSAIPVYIEPFLQDMMKNAPMPQLFKSKKETIEVESTNNEDKKAGLFFKKKDTATEKKVIETKIPVTVDPQVLEIKYFKKNELCGSIIPLKPGKPGKSVRGQIIAASTIKDSNFYLGSGLYRKKDEVYAAASGIFRIGANWADIIPFSKNSYTIEYDPFVHSLSMFYEVGDTRFEKPMPEQILAEAQEKLREGQELIDSKEFLTRFTNAQSNSDDEFRVLLCKDYDSEITINIAADKTSATLFLHKAVAGGVPLELRNISAAINQYRFKGLSLETIKKDIKAFFSSEDIILRDYPLTAGIIPERGENRTAVLKTVPCSDTEKKELFNQLGAENGKFPELPFPLAESDSISLVKSRQHIIEFSAPKIGKSGIDIFGNPISGLPGNDPQVEVTGELTVNSNGIYADKDGLLAVKDKDGVLLVALIPYKESSVSISVSEDELAAWAYLTGAEGFAAPLSAAAVQTALTKFNVVYGIDSAAIEQSVEKVNKTGVAGKYCVARGQIPADPGSYVIQWIVQPNDGKASSGIEKGTVLANIEKIPDDEPRKGYTVHGRELDNKYATAIMELSHDASVAEQHHEDGSIVLTAQTNGELFYTNGFISIKNERVISTDIDAHIGNIKFSGSLQVDGKITKGHVILAEGDIAVDGLVEESLVSSNGCIILSNGIFGNGKGILRAKNTIKTPFAEKSRLYAGQDIFITRHSFDCQIKTNTVLHIDTENATLTGGVVLASKGIIAYDIGSSRGTHTEISFGQNYLIADQIDVTEKEIDKIKIQLSGIERELKKMSQLLPALSVEKTKKLRMLKVTAMKILQQKFLRLFTLRERFEVHIPSSIIVKNAVWPGVILESHGRYLEITKQRTSVIFSFDVHSGRIIEQPLDKVT